MICSNCERVGKELVKNFTNAERLFILGATIAMLRSIESGRKDPNDMLVGNSVMTKVLLSYEQNSRGTLLEHFRRGVGMGIKLGDCPHGIRVVS
jgi:hypothetical protein